jgi:hypothetical protein
VAELGGGDMELSVYSVGVFVRVARSLFVCLLYCIAASRKHRRSFFLLLLCELRYPCWAGALRFALYDMSGEPLFFSFFFFLSLSLLSMNGIRNLVKYSVPISSLPLSAFEATASSSGGDDKTRRSRQDRDGIHTCRDRARGVSDCCSGRGQHMME